MHEPLLQQEQLPPPQGCLSRLLGRVQPQSRIIRLGGEVRPPCAVSNLVNNRKYTVLSFLPLCLLSQFRFFMNQFFLATAFSQFIPVLKIGLLFTYFAPLALVLTISIIKELAYEVQRFRRDRDTNSRQYYCYSRQQKVTSGNLLVGDVIQIESGERVPADSVILSASSAQGHVFIKTDQLDGETDWKLRKAVKSTQGMAAEQFAESGLSVFAKAPSGQIYSFQGLLLRDQDKEPLSLENSIWANTVLASGSVVAVVVYTGLQTRLSLNSSAPVTKFGKTDEDIDWVTKLLFGVLVLLALLCGMANNSWSLGLLVQFWRFLIIFSSVIPVSLRVNLDLGKLFQSQRINRDPLMPDSLTRNSNIPEELGRISYVFSDKTGTLTKNDMVFKKLSLLSRCLDSDDLADIAEAVALLPPIGLSSHFIQSQRLCMMVRALSLCHNVTPIEEPPFLQASSPDEFALVSAGQKFGLKLLSKDEETCAIQTPRGREVYRILQNFPFSSERKRMGIVLQDKDGKVHFFLKGADSVMRNTLVDQVRGFVDEECDNLSREGLRTLVFAYRQLPFEEYQDWARRLARAREQLDERLVTEVACEVERHLELLGVSGVEDRLQDRIEASLESLGSAGVKVWMLTGDKVETAICICISSGLKPKHAGFYRIKSEAPIAAQLKEYATMADKLVLVLDGNSLSQAIETGIFFKCTEEAVAVACCRVSPLQKARVVQGMKEHLRGQGKGFLRCLAIGDGGNDVAMIQASDVGVGILGKEGKLAALSSDISLGEFQHLVRLMLWHGRTNYKSTCLLAQFIVYRGVLISVLFLLFSCSFYFVSLPLFNSTLALGYATLFTMFPVFAMILDHDVSQEVALSEPRLYSNVARGKQVSVLSFTSWNAKALLQGSLLLFLLMAMAPAQYEVFEGMTYTALMLTLYSMVMLEMASFSLVPLLLAAATLLLYLLLLQFFPSVIQLQPLSLKQLGQAALASLCALAPVCGAELLLSWHRPEEHVRVMRAERRKQLIAHNVSQYRESVDSKV